MIQPKRQVLPVHTVIYTCVIAYAMINMSVCMLQVCCISIWYHSVIDLLVRYESIQFADFLGGQNQLRSLCIINYKHIKCWTCIVLVSLHMTWEPPTKLDWMKRLHWLTTISGCSRSRSSPGHSSGPDHIHSRRSSAWFALFNLLQKKGTNVWWFRRAWHLERAGLSEYLGRPLYPFLWHQSLWPNNRFEEMKYSRR